MDTLQAIILGIVQGLTEYLPVSSSGHLEIVKILLGVDPKAGGLTFDIVVHVATVLSTLVILWKEVGWILQGLLKFRWNDEARYTLNIVVSMIPVGIVGLCFKDSIKSIYEDNEPLLVIIVTACLLLTAALLTFSYYAKPRPKDNISLLDAFVIGLAQAAAVLPGLSRSGSTIATGQLLGIDKAKLAQFSFLMVIPPILGEALLDVMEAIKHGAEADTGGIELVPLAAGFLAAFVSGALACKWMIGLVRRGKLIYFAAYCSLAALALIVYQLAA